jgi:prolyl-tRNA synthetase
LAILVLRGDHALNEIKAEKIDGILAPLEFASDEEILLACACEKGSIGPKDLSIRTIADRSVTNLADFVCGANQQGKHYTGVNWERDLKLPTEIADLRSVVEGERC